MEWGKENKQASDLPHKSPPLTGMVCPGYRERGAQYALIFLSYIHAHIHTM